MTKREKVIKGLELLANWPDGLIFPDKEKWIKPCCERAVAMLKEQEPVEMSATEKVVNDLNVSKLMLCNPQVLTPEMCVKIGQAINSAIDLLTEQETANTGRCRIFQCKKCGFGIDDIFVNDEEKYQIVPRYCPNCGRSVKWNDI